MPSRGTIECLRFRGLRALADVEVPEAVFDRSSGGETFRVDHTKISCFARFLIVDHESSWKNEGCISWANGYSGYCEGCSRRSSRPHGVVASWLAEGRLFSYSGERRPYVDDTWEG